MRQTRDLSNASYTIINHSYGFPQYIAGNKVAGLIKVAGLMVIKNGIVVVEFYGRRNTRQTLWTSRSVGKSIVSTLVGVTLKEGKIKLLDDKVLDNNRVVKGTVWLNVTVQQLLEHTSGVRWRENYEVKIRILLK